MPVAEGCARITYAESLAKRCKKKARRPDRRTCAHASAPADDPITASETPSARRSSLGSVGIAIVVGMVCTSSTRDCSAADRLTPTSTRSHDRSSDAARECRRLTLTLPDGATRTVPPARCPPTSCARSASGCCAPRSPCRGRRRDPGPHDAAPRRAAAFRVLTERDADALDVLRHSAAHVLATAVRRLRPDAKIGFGPAIEDGFYYDFEVDAAVHARGSRRVRGGDAEGRRREVSVRARGGRSRGEAQQALRRRSAQARAALASSATTRSSRPTPTGRSSTCAAARTCPTRRALKHFKLTAHRRRVLARRREAPDAAAHLRHGVLQEGRARRVPHRASRRRRSATIACSAASSICS